VDVYLIHWPCSDELNIASWKAFEELHDQGTVRTIGLSNFTIRQLEPLLLAATHAPRLNQLEVHPYHYKPDLLEYCARHGILVEAWSPLMQGGAFSDDVLNRVAEKHGRSAAQVALRWSVQMGAVPLPKTRTPSRMVENISIFDFELDKDDMAAIGKLNIRRRLGPDPGAHHFCR
jgi:diketogulonate reductase-like aldo/keto reductase